MLVLTRRLEEVVILSGTGKCRVTILGIGRDKVRIGFEANKEIEILWEELVGTDRDGAGDGRGGGR
jgi:carbon storage regulator CsrA